MSLFKKEFEEKGFCRIPKAFPLPLISWDLEWILQRRAIWIAALQKYQPNKTFLIPDAEELQPYINNLNLRVSHTNDKIQYDMESPYNHFA